MTRSPLVLLVLMMASSLCPVAAGAAGRAKAHDAAVAAVEAQRASSGRHRREALAAVKTWGIQLRLIDAGRIAASPFDLVVVDYAAYRHLSFEFPFSVADVKKMQTGAAGKRRLVLSYLSIGEAEDYRYYWNSAWRKADTKPGWLGVENPKWPGNYPVRFWDPEWQKIIVDGPESYLDRLIAAGYDGVYLDRADVFEEWVKTNPQAGTQMAQFILKLADHARQKRPGFLVVLQNAEELLRRPEVRKAIDGFAKEDLYFGAQASEEANPAKMVSYSLDQLRLGRRSGLKILVLEYLSDAVKAAYARKSIAREGFLPHIAERSLGTLALKGPDEIEAQGMGAQ